MDLRRNRPNSTNINVALCNGNRNLHYSSFALDPCRGFVEFMSLPFFLYWHSALLNPGVNTSLAYEMPDPWNNEEFLTKIINREKFKSLPVIPCVSAKAVMSQLNLRHVDLWVLDTEGAEESILNSTDFSAVNIDVIAMECRNDNDADKLANNRKTAILERNNYICQQVERNCMCKRKDYKKSEISSSEDDRTLLYPERKRKNRPYRSPAII